MCESEVEPESECAWVCVFEGARLIRGAMSSHQPQIASQQRTSYRTVVQRSSENRYLKSIPPNSFNELANPFFGQILFELLSCFSFLGIL